jgi:hypothetical protein
MKFSRIEIILFSQYPFLIDWVSEWLLFNVNSAIFQLWYGESKLIINEMMMRSTKILHAVIGGLLSYCDKVYSRGNINQKHRIGYVMVSVLASCVIDRGCEPRSGQTKDYKIGMCCFSPKHAALRRKSKDWLARNQNNVSEWSDISNRCGAFDWCYHVNILCHSMIVVLLWLHAKF